MSLVENIQAMRLTVWDCEMLALTKITTSNREREADLMTRKWYDYRHLHPVQATYLFAHFYEEAIRDAFAQTRDKHTADKINVFKAGDIFNSQELSSIWRARQRFDALGVRYDFALRYLMKRFTERGWHILPRPNQLYSEEVLLDIRDAWAEECKASIQSVKHPRFQVSQQPSRDQAAYQEWLVRQVMVREQPHLTLARLVNEGFFTKEDAAKRFGQDMVKRAGKRIVV